ncbi:MAG: DUF370 domain-containing protein [Ruminococcaceae bacterium]|nr:DUF370 domain-containing protein [Oscillospiraceae bacterium]
MYIHIGGARAVREREIIGCFDMDGRVMSDTTVEFLKKCEKEGKTSSADSDLPRSFVLTDGGVIFSHISTAAIKNR